MTKQDLTGLLCYNFPILSEQVKITDFQDGEVYIVIDSKIVSSQDVNCFLKNNAPLGIAWRVVTDFQFSLYLKNLKNLKSFAGFMVHGVSYGDNHNFRLVSRYLDGRWLYIDELGYMPKTPIKDFVVNVN